MVIEKGYFHSKEFFLSSMIIIIIMNSRCILYCQNKDWDDPKFSKSFSFFLVFALTEILVKYCPKKSAIICHV